MTSRNHYVFEIANFELREIVVGISSVPLEDVKRTHPLLAPSMWRPEDHVVYRKVAGSLSVDEAAAFALEHAGSEALKPYTVFVAGLTSAGVAAAAAA